MLRNRFLRLLAPGVVALLLLSGCGGGTETVRPAASDPTPSATPEDVRRGEVRVLHTSDGGSDVVQLQAVLLDGTVVYTTIGSDGDTGEEDLAWNAARAALLAQLRAAMAALGWEEAATGPSWWQVRFTGGPDARIPVVDPTSRPSAAPTRPPEPEEPEPEAPRANDEISDLLALMGRGADDPEVSRLMRSCGPGTDVHRSGNIACLSKGFELTLSGPDLVVTSISLFSAELDGYGEYVGALPLGLSWDDGYYDIVRELGEPHRQVGGGGVTVNLQYPAGDVWMVLTTSATHDRPEYLEGSRLLRIDITKHPTYDFPKPEPIDPDWSD